MKSLTPEERRLIDEAISAGRVTRVPAGVSGYNDAIRYDEKTGQLRYCDADFAKNQLVSRTKAARNRQRAGTPTPAVAARRKEVREMFHKGMSGPAIAKALGASIQIIYNDTCAMGLKLSDNRVVKSPEPKKLEPKVKEPKPFKPRKRVLETPDQKRARQAEESRRKIKDRRRFKDVIPADGSKSKIAPADATGTIFPNRVLDPTPDETVLKCGRNNSKIGGDVLVGRLKGARIFALTLEERATCPKSCAHWRTCYGSNMQWSTRWRHGPALESRLRQEVPALCAEHEQVLIRLHVLGDFYRVEYVALWYSLLMVLPNLTVFGFTAWGHDTVIGAAVARCRDMMPDRFMIRHSGRSGEWGAFTIPFDPAGEKMIGDAVICPEQVNAVDRPERRTHCGNCAICWSSGVPIVFVQH